MSKYESMFISFGKVSNVVRNSESEGNGDFIQKVSEYLDSKSAKGRLHSVTPVANNGVQGVLIIFEIK